MNIYLMIEAN